MTDTEINLKISEIVYGYRPGKDKCLPYAVKINLAWMALEDSGLLDTRPLFIEKFADKYRVCEHDFMDFIIITEAHTAAKAICLAIIILNKK